MNTNGQHEEIDKICSRCTRNAERFEAATEKLVMINTTTDDTNDKVSKITHYIHHLDKLPEMASAMKIHAYTNLLLVALLSLFVLVILIKGSEMHINVPGWLEIDGKHAPRQ